MINRGLELGLNYRGNLGKLNLVLAETSQVLKEWLLVWATVEKKPNNADIIK
jgi:hypothetical protein